MAKVTQADKEVILKAHNELRRKVALGKEKRGINGAQPPASNMREMVTVCSFSVPIKSIN